jgi:phospholipase/lecithinase/hemolysin
VKKLFQVTLVVLFLGAFRFQAHAAYSSLYVFGDGLSTTTNNPSILTQSYYGKRRSNGRVWCEVLAQRQGVGISNNWSYFDCNSANLVANVQNFKAPSDAANTLFVIWVNNSDLFDEAVNGNSILAEWTSAINRCQTNYFKAITNLYAKGLRTLIAPNAVDISAIPYFNASLNARFIRQECIAFNTNFTATLNQARAACPGLKIFSPDYFALLDDALTNDVKYGLNNVTLLGLSIDAINNPLLLNKSMTGPGANYVFWDPYDPSARLHAVMGDVAQQLVSPVQISQVAVLAGSNRLDLVNVPVGLNGFVDGSTITNRVQPPWTSVQNFNSTATAQSIFVIAPQFPPFLIDTNSSDGGGGGSIDPGNVATNSASSFVQATHAQFYRLRFPYAWNWP